MKVASSAVVPDLAQSSCHGSLHSFIRGPSGPGLVVQVGDVDVDSVAVLVGFLTRREHAQPGHGRLLLGRGNCLTQGPAQSALSAGNPCSIFYLFLCPVQGLENQDVGLVLFGFLSDNWKTVCS